MHTICVVCNALSSGMIAIHNHPNNLDKMLNFISGHVVAVDDHLCVICYDDLKVAFNFKRKCFESQSFRPGVSEAETQTETLRGSEEIEKIIIEDDTPDVDMTTSISEAESEPETISQQQQCGAITTTTTSGTDSRLEKYGKYDEAIISLANYLNSDEEISEVLIDDECRLDEDIISIKDNLVDYIDQNNDEQTSRKPNKSTEKEPRRPRDKHRRGPIPKYHENEIYRNLQSTQCEFCFKILDSAASLKTHEQSHAYEERPYKCNHSGCTATFDKRYKLRTHMSTHNSEKRFHCSYCTQTFHQKGNLAAHERSHNDERPFECLQCDRKFNEQCNLKAHMRLHTGEQPYECSYCRKTFKFHNAFKVHVKQHENKRDHKCATCGKAFISTSKLRIHERIHTGERPYKCDVCENAFMDSTRLKRHKKCHEK